MKNAPVKKGGLGQPEDEWDGADDDIILELPPPPDGGYGWVIVICSFICNMLIDGLCFTFGVFLNEFAIYFNASRSKISLAGGLLGGGSCLMGPVVSAFTNRYGCRPVMITGFILSAGFLALSVLSPNADILVAIYGLLGLSTGLVFLPGIVSVSYYFEEKRAISTGIAACGGGVGAFVAGPIALYLVEKFGWKGANLVLAAIYLSCVIAGVLNRPLQAVAIPKEEKKELLYQLTQRRGTCVSFETGSFSLPRGTSVKHRRSSASQYSSSSDTSEVGNINYGFDLASIAEDHPTIPEEDEEVEDDMSDGENGSTEADDGVKAEDKNTLENTPKASKKSSSLSENTPQTVKLSEDTDRNASESNSKPLEPNFKPTKSFKNFGSSKIYKTSSSNIEEEEPIRSNISIYSVHRRQSCFNLPPTEASVCVSLADNHRVQKSLRHGNVVSPLSRKDTFYQGSVRKLKQHHSRNSVLPYRQSVLRFNPVANVEVVKDSEAETPDKGTCSKLFCHESFCNILSHMIDVSLLKNLSFLLIGISNLFYLMGFYIPVFFIVDAAIEQGVDKASAALLVSAIGIANCIGRALSGVLATLPGVDCFLVHNMGMLLCGVSAVGIGFVSNFVGFACCAACFGLFGAASIALTTVVLVSLLSLEKLTSAFGLLILFRGPAIFTGSPVAGAVYEASGSYKLTFFFGGGLIILGSLFSFLVMIIKICRKKGRRTKLSRNYI